MTKNYRIGLDIGIGSVGWAVIENNIETEEAERILDLGVRTFPVNEVEKTGESTAKARREARGVRRRNRRKAFRRHRLIKLIERTFGITESEIYAFKVPDIYKLRAKALDEEISPVELARIILNINKRRGFYSTSNATQSSKEEGKLKLALSENLKYLLESGYRTIGEALHKSSRFKLESAGNIVYNIRNHSGDYRNCFTRQELASELQKILDTQKEFNNKITDEFISLILEIFNSQRNFDEGPGVPSPYSATFEVGKCTFIPANTRAPKASYTFEYFTALSKLNNLKIGDEKLSDDERNKVIDLIKQKESITFEKLRKELSVPVDKIFNLCRYKIYGKDESLTPDEILKKAEKTTFITMRHSYSIKKALGIKNENVDIGLIDELAVMLSLTKSDARRDEYIKNSETLSGLTEEQKTAVKELNFDKFGALSIEAMLMIIPFLEQGQRYDEACKSVGFNHSSFEKPKQKYLKPELIPELNDITSPVVKRAVNQTVRVMNQIIKKYGSPQFVTIELSREMSKNRKQRDLAVRLQTENEKKNEDARQRLINEFGVENPTHFDILKLRLYDEQCGKCMYSGGEIESSRWFEPNYLQVDHILPYSKTLNDSFNNKVLVIADENQNKGNRTPFEFFGDDPVKWENFVARVKTLRNREKQRNLLKEHITKEEQENFTDRNLNDTKYMSKLLHGVFKDFLETAPSKKYKKAIRCINGSVTNYLRKCWGINKLREDGDVHHAIDACVIAVAEEKQVQKISIFNKFKEEFKEDEKNGLFINRRTGEVMDKAQKQEYEDAQINLLAGKLPQPYDGFRKELLIRSSTKYKELEFSEFEKSELKSIGYETEEIDAIHPIFVSRMKTVKKTGAIHEETIMSTRDYDETKMLIKSVSLSKLKIENKAEEVQLKDDPDPSCRIANYYRPQDDRLLYLKLKNYLLNEGFTIPENLEFRKPRKDGTDGPIVRKVKVYEKMTNFVKLPTGGASNDRMYRLDVYKKDDKYYFCPVYKADVYNKTLPNKLFSNTGDWPSIDDSYKFQFSLFKNDLIKVTLKKPNTLKKEIINPKSDKPNAIEITEVLAYFDGFNINSGAIALKSHDSCYATSLGGKTLPNIEKYYVDILGKIYKAPIETRKEL